MTAVASPPSLQSLPHLGWNPPAKASSGGLDTTSSIADAARGFALRPVPQRTSSASSLGSASSAISDAATAIPDDPPHESPRAALVALRDQLPTLVAARDQLSGRIKSGHTLLHQEKVKETLHAEALEAIANGRVNGGIGAPGPPAAPVVPSQRPSMQQPQQLNGARMAMPGPQQNADPPVLLALLPMNGTFERKQIIVPYDPQNIRIGRQTNAKTVPTPVNGFFDSKVLSRQHAEVWADRNGRVWIRDVKSSNGTFVNGQRLSPESRDSEPHELRENDMLELGIDIVSEDQKSIVHHKVSAKIEHAGVQTNSSSVLDLNLADIDPGLGGGMGGLLPQNRAHNRAGSQGSVMTNGSRMSQSINGNLNAMGVQRHMNAWLSPVSIEQVVKRLGNELKQAKQQAQDLHRTSDFFNAVLNTSPGQDPPKPPASILPPVAPPQTNGISPKKVGDPLSPYSQPPAPPPQQPLPEKPDSAALHSPKPNLSPSKVDASSSQILSLAEALAAARQELDSQGSKMRYLEELLRQERQARETAEQRARALLEQSHARAGPEFADDALDVPLAAEAPFDPTAAERDADTASVASAATLLPGSMPESPVAPTHADGARDTPLQDRFTLLLAEMADMKTQMEAYKQRAIAAEAERGSLADMVARIRAESSTAGAKHPRRGSGSRSRSSSRPDAAVANGTTRHFVDDEGMPLRGLRKSATVTQRGISYGEGADGEGDEGDQEDGELKRRQLAMLQTAMQEALAGGDGRLAQAAPYASMLGVVLLGVGLMAWLNGWKAVEQ